jgi:hypothetical protein
MEKHQYSYQIWVVKSILNSEAKALTETETRIRIFSEILSGIRNMKLHSWETPLVGRLDEHRKLELKHLKKVTLLSSTFYGLTFVVPALLAITSFSVYAALGYSLSASIIFPALAVIGMLRVPMLDLPERIT